AGYDVIDRLGSITVPVLAIGGAEDGVCSPREQRRIAEGAQSGSYLILPGVAHQAPAEAPEATARAIIEAFATAGAAATGANAPSTAAEPTGPEAIAADARARAGVPLQDTYDAGMVVRREVL